MTAAIRPDRWHLRTACVALAAACAGLPAHADDASDAARERARIRAERLAAQTQFAQKEKECRTRFVVTSCIDDARGELRATEARLRGEETVVSDAERKRRAAARLKEIETNAEREKVRQAEAAAKAASSAADASASGPLGPHTRFTPNPRPANMPSEPHPSNFGIRPAAPASSPEERRAEEARNRAAHEARQQAVEAHRTAVEARNAARAARGKVAAPLPVPGAASAPASAP